METSFKDNILINDLIISFISGNATLEETKQLKILIYENVEIRNLYHAIKISWDASSELNSDRGKVDCELAWDKIKDNVYGIEPKEKELKNRSFPFFLRTAAIWLLFLTSGSFLTWLTMRDSSKQIGGQMLSVSIPHGTKSYLVLADGTEVWMNAGTTLKYPGVFSSKQRDIYLSGEAYFKVASNREWPFVVHTTELNIKALGTSFNVKAYPAEKFVTTTLVEGIVKLENGKRKFSYTLKPKQELVFLKEQITNISGKKNLVNSNLDNSNYEIGEIEERKDAIIKTNVNTENAVSWKENRWKIKGETLENLSVMLERRFNIEINLLSEDIKGFKFTGIIENETIDQLLKYMSYTIPIKYEINKGTVDLLIDSTLKEKNKIHIKRK